MWCYSNNRVWETGVFQSIEVHHSYTNGRGKRLHAESWTYTSVVCLDMPSESYLWTVL